MLPALVRGAASECESESGNGNGNKNGGANLIARWIFTLSPCFLQTAPK